MRIAAITHFKHGALFEALRALQWSQSELSRRTGINQTAISAYCTLKLKPTPERAAQIEKIFVESGYDFDAREAWPESFKGFKKKLACEQVKDITQLELEAAQGFYEMLELEPGKNLDAALDVREAITAIPEREALAVRESFGIGAEVKSFEQIGKELGVGRQAAYSTMQRGLQKIRHQLNLQPLIHVDNPIPKPKLCQHKLAEMICPQCHPKPQEPPKPAEQESHSWVESGFHS
jgi:transcriptional regulator with XRE-family HTH domain